MFGRVVKLLLRLPLCLGLLQTQQLLLKLDNLLLQLLLLSLRTQEAEIFKRFVTPP
jgi:hypothetical protein